MSFLKGDGAGAYENLLLRPPGAPWAAIVLWDEAQKSWSAFPPRTLMFGDTESVSRYNIFRGLLVCIINRLLGIPLIDFYDGLGSPMLGILANGALRVVREVFLLLGVILKHSRWGVGNPFLFGLLGAFASRSNRGNLATNGLLILVASLTMWVFAYWRCLIRPIDGCAGNADGRYFGRCIICCAPRILIRRFIRLSPRFFGESPMSDPTHTLITAAGGISETSVCGLRDFYGGSV